MIIRRYNQSREMLFYFNGRLRDLRVFSIITCLYSKSIFKVKHSAICSRLCLGHGLTTSVWFSTSHQSESSIELMVQLTSTLHNPLHVSPLDPCSHVWQAKIHRVGNIICNQPPTAIQSLPSEDHIGAGQHFPSLTSGDWFTMQTFFLKKTS